MNAPEVLLFLRDPRHDGQRGRLVMVDTSAGDGRVCVLFEGADRPLLGLGEELEVELFGTSLGHTVNGKARVLQHRVGSGVAFYVLELPPGCRASLENLLERRGSERARPAVVAPIDGTLSASDGSLAREVVVKDLSTTGAGLLLRPPEDLALLLQPGMLLVFTLPGESAPIELRIQLASRRPAGTQLHYGVSFDISATPGIGEVRARIADWVAQRAVGSAGRVG